MKKKNEKKKKKKRSRINLNKPIYIRASILDLSKVLIEDVHYSYIKWKIWY